MGLYMTVKVTKSKWIAGADYWTDAEYVTLGADRDKISEAGISRADVLENAEYLARLFNAKGGQPVSVLCRVLTDYDDKYFAVCTLELLEEQPKP